MRVPVWVVGSRRRRCSGEREDARVLPRGIVIGDGGCVAEGHFGHASVERVVGASSEGWNSVHGWFTSGDEAVQLMNKINLRRAALCARHTFLPVENLELLPELVLAGSLRSPSSVRRLTFIELPEPTTADGLPTECEDLRGETLVEPGAFLVMKGFVLEAASQNTTTVRDTGYSQISLGIRRIKAVYRNVCMRAGSQGRRRILGWCRMPRLAGFRWRLGLRHLDFGYDQEVCVSA